MSPTYEASVRVLRELRKLPLEQRRAFLAARDEFVAALQSTGLAAGIIIDATIVRGVLAPALLTLLSRFNWAMPHPVARVLRIPRMPNPTRD